MIHFREGRAELKPSGRNMDSSSPIRPMENGWRTRRICRNCTGPLERVSGAWKPGVRIYMITSYEDAERYFDAKADKEPQDIQWNVKDIFLISSRGPKPPRKTGR